jgi:phospholipid-binding lipoprotein MlaA
MFGFNITLRKIYAMPLIILLGLSSCSSIPEGQQSDSRDTYEDTNRSIFAFNLATDDYVLEPVAKTYRDTVPLSAQTAISNHVEWVGLPSTTLNSSLQGKFENATLAGLRFLVNGLTFGLVDLMENEDEPERKDFGQTLALAGVSEGSYLMVPLLGSHTTRSLAGRGFDFMFNPISFVGGSSATAIRTAETPVAALTFRSNSFDAINQIKYNSIDPYARTRSAYYQRRASQLVDIQPDKVDEDDGFGVFFE